MPNINQMKTSNFLTKEDCGERGILVTISGNATQKNVAMAGAPEELKWCLHFDECEKPMVLNSINSQVIAKITGSENTEDWAGHKVVLYNDPMVSYAGKLTGGIRVRAPRNQPAPAQPRAAQRAAQPIQSRPAVMPPPAEPEPDMPPTDSGEPF